MDLSLVGATLLGLFGGLHCIGMCGGISASLAGALPQSGAVGGRVRAQLGYNLGRILSYSIAGALAGGVGLSVLALLGPVGITALRMDNKNRLLMSAKMMNESTLHLSGHVLL